MLYIERRAEARMREHADANTQYAMYLSFACGTQRSVSVALVYMSRTLSTERSRADRERSFVLGVQYNEIEK